MKTEKGKPDFMSNQDDFDIRSIDAPPFIEEVESMFEESRIYNPLSTRNTIMVIQSKPSNKTKKKKKRMDDDEEFERAIKVNEAEAVAQILERSDEKIRLQTELVSRGESDPSPKRMSDAGTEEMDLANVMRLSNFANFRDTELKELSSS